jgi:hypothetical protein
MGYLKTFVIALAVIALARFTLFNGSQGERADESGLLLPEGFEAVMLVDSLGPARHIAVRE